MSYQVIKASSRAEAYRKSDFNVGDLVRVKRINAIPNSDGTFTIFTYVEKLDESKRVSETSS